MPPEQTKNNNISNFEPIKIGLDPIFNTVSTKKQDPEQNIGGAYGILNNQKYIPNQPNIPTPSKPEGDKETNSKSLVRTYKSDLETAIATNHLSSINIAIAESERAHSQTETSKEAGSFLSNYSKNKTIIFVSILLIVVGIIGISIIFITGKQNSNSVPQVQELPSLITTEYKEELNINSVPKAKLIMILSNKINSTQITLNNIDNIYLTTGTSSGRRLLTSTEFVSLMDFRMPDIMKRSLLQNYMVGMFFFGKDMPFLIFKTSSFDNSYAGMLNWEPNLETDLRSLFRLPGYENLEGTLVELAPEAVKKFEDGVIVNKDVRILKGNDGKIILLYGIIDKQTIIITTTDTVFKEIVARINKEKTLQR